MISLIILWCIIYFIQKHSFKSLKISKLMGRGLPSTHFRHVLLKIVILTSRLNVIFLYTYAICLQ